MGKVAFPRLNVTRVRMT